MALRDRQLCAKSGISAVTCQSRGEAGQPAKIFAEIRLTDQKSG